MLAQLRTLRPAAAPLRKPGASTVHPARSQHSAMLTGHARRLPALRAATVDAESPSKRREPPSNGKPSVSSMPPPLTQPDEGECGVWVDRDGNMQEVMCCDYGYHMGEDRLYVQDGAIPDSGFTLAVRHFQEELGNVRRAFREDDFAGIAQVNPPTGPIGKVMYAAGGQLVKWTAALDKQLEAWHLLPKLETGPSSPLPSDSQGNVTKQCLELRANLRRLQLSNAAVWAREHAREKAGGEVKSSWVVKAVYLGLCHFLDAVFNNRPIQRFWFLECVARMPYFSYISCLHLYETLGWWRAAAELRKVHFAEEWNELHHLQIMESLGGDRLWSDRFLAYHSSVLYYFVLVALFIASPGMAYNFSELLEAHAVDTYNEFAESNKELLQSLPPPLVAVIYYKGSDLYMFDEFQPGTRAAPRQVECRTLYDVFINIRDDEGQHVDTMKACQTSRVMDDLAARKELKRRT